MNIFKKTLNNSLFSRAEQRVISLFKEHIPKRKKAQYRLLCLRFFFSLSLGLLGLLCLEYNANLFGAFSCMISIVLILMMIVELFHVFQLSFYGKHLKSSEDKGYHFLSKNFDFNADLNVLNNEEVNELLSSDLHPVQLKYLQNKIIYNRYITLEDLKEVDKIMLEENQQNTSNVLEKQIENEKNSLNDFFSIYEIAHNKNHQILVDNINSSAGAYRKTASNEKEATLASRL